MAINRANRKHYCPYCGSSTEKLYSPESAAKMLECSVEKIRKMIQKREISYRKIGRLVRIPCSEIDKIGQYFPSIYQ
jgi:excisionase family DNA binding protein